MSQDDVMGGLETEFDVWAVAMRQLQDSIADEIIDKILTEESKGVNDEISP